MNNFDFTDNSNIGKEYNGFILLKIDDIPKEKCKAVFLRHKTTGLEVYHVLKDDKENLFGFNFCRTYCRRHPDIFNGWEWQ